MSELNTLFRRKIKVSTNEEITFTALNTILEKTATTFPFGNLSIIANKTEVVTKENLINKLLIRNEGGLCFELNPLLYFFLIENGFNATLVRGEVYNDEKQDWYHFGRTHVAILLHHEEQTYLLDTGFGGNLPLKPVPLNGDTVISRNGDFRVQRQQTEYGNNVLQFKLRYKHTDWQMGYTFDSNHPVADMMELNELQEIIVQDERSPFNKSPLITKLTSNGNVTLTNNSFTQWSHGKSKKEQIDEARFKQLVHQYFGLQVL
ncbi:arylamine N-acetyltransferase family protein [Gracilibacillus suaedae]|uniref:arylamine N-acetyltransferase family protein n=1 Tax=Gracilibacillus suaedae TaxID=2820273 RepID=UPI001ABECE37|nr:arylamine N-acetyltransferase [Gracilibacillus suaedae]